MPAEQALPLRDEYAFNAQMQALLDTIWQKNRDGTLLRNVLFKHLYARKSVDCLSSFEHEPVDEVRVINELFLVQGLAGEDLLCQRFQCIEDEDESMIRFEGFDAASYQKIAEVVFGPSECKERYWHNSFFDDVYDAIVAVLLKSTQAAEKEIHNLVFNYFSSLGLKEGSYDEELAGEFEDAFGAMHEILMTAIH
jgi:hypothetical protein